MTPQGAASTIDAVTVYRRGARITRVADIAAEGGSFPAMVRISGLPLGLEDTSVRARVEPVDGDAALAGDGSLPSAFDLRVVLDVPEPDAMLRPADDGELESARAEEQRLEQDVAHIENQLAQLDRLGLVPRPRGKAGSPPTSSPTAARLSLIRFKTDRTRKLTQELNQTRDQLDLARRRRNVAEDAARRASSARQAHEHELRKAVLVSLRGGRGEGEGAPRRCRLHLDYLVPGARWAPAYALRLEDGMTAAALSLRAIVAQNTGEDWRAVALTLSTAEAQVWTELPELASIRIGRRQPSPPRVGWRPPPTGVDDLYGDWDREFGGRVPRPTPSLQSPGGLVEEPTRVTSLADADPNTITSVLVRPTPSQLESRGQGDDFDEDTLVRGTRAPAAPLAPDEQTSPVVARPAVARMRRSTIAAAGVPAAMARGPAARSADKKPGAAQTPAPQAADGGAPAGAVAALPSEPVPLVATPQPVELEASPDMLRFADLRMPPPSSRRRGRLVLASRVELYLALLIEQRVEVRFDVMAAVETARQRSLAISLPPGYVLSWAQGYDYAYRAEARVDVPSDGDSHSLPLGQRSSASEPLHVVVPRESHDVFRTATVENPFDSPLLPGPVDVYLRGDFLLTSRLELTPPRGTFTVGLGVEQGIAVARNTRYREESAGLMGGALLLHHQIYIELRNNLGQPAPLEVRERIPVVRDEQDDIQVSVHSVRPAWEAWEQEQAWPSEPRLRGGHRWRVTLPAGGREELRVDYDIRIPAKQELAGGNRREE